MLLEIRFTVVSWPATNPTIGIPSKLATAAAAHSNRGEAGWLKASGLEVYAPGRARSGSLHQAPFSYHEAWG